MNLKHKSFATAVRVLLSLVLVMPILGALGVFPEPTSDMYSPTAWAFIQAIMDAKYIMILDSIVFLVSLWALWTKRAGLAALLLLPVTVNIVAFHVFLDRGLFVPDAIPADILLLGNVYFLWLHKDQYKTLCAQHK